MEPAAANALREFALTIEQKMRPGAVLEPITDWASKLPGAVAGLAGIFHMFEHVDDDICNQLINVETMTQALLLADVLTAHALAAFDLMGADPDVVTARRVLAWITAQKTPTVTARPGLLRPTRPATSAWRSWNRPSPSWRSVATSVRPSPIRAGGVARAAFSR